MTRFDGQVALVTGAGRGLGQAYAGWLAARGARVVVNNRVHPDRPSAAAAVAQALNDAGGTAIADGHAVETEDGAQAMVQTALNAWGRLDILICNAAVGSEHLELQATSSEDLRRIVDINLWGSILPVQAALAAMVPAGYGRIVLTTSAAGLYGQKEGAAYGTTKAALVGLARCVAQDNRDRDIHINVVSPYARTEMAKNINPAFSDLMSPDRVAPVVGFLASPACTRSGMILAAGSGRVRSVHLCEGPMAPVPHDINTFWPELDDLTQIYAPTSMRNSALSLTPEITGGPPPL